MKVNDRNLFMLPKNSTCPSLLSDAAAQGEIWSATKEVNFLQ